MALNDTTPIQLQASPFIQSSNMNVVTRKKEDFMEPPESVKEIWRAAAMKVENYHTVSWTKSASSLQEASRHFETSTYARNFVENYMFEIVNILLNQNPQKIGWTEEDCVEKSLKHALNIVAKDLEANRFRSSCFVGEQNSMLDVLASIFNRRKPYYTNVTDLSSEIRVHMVNYFRKIGGFRYLLSYLRFLASKDEFPSFNVVHILLEGVRDTICLKRHFPLKPDEIESVVTDAKAIFSIVMDHLLSLSAYSIGNQSPLFFKWFYCLIEDFYKLLHATNPEYIVEFVEFGKQLASNLLKSPIPSLGHMVIAYLLKLSEEMQLPPSSYHVGGAGSSFVNGRYDLSSSKVGVGLIYTRVVPSDAMEEEMRGKKLSLTRRKQPFQCEQWFLSCACEDQSGPGKGIDYYENNTPLNKKLKKKEFLPLRGWLPSGEGLHPPPELKPVVSEEDDNHLSRSMLSWLMEEKLFDVMLEDGHQKGYISPILLTMASFACRMWKNKSCNFSACFPSNNPYLLQARGLIIPWKTCLEESNGDAEKLLDIFFEEAGAPAMKVAIPSPISSASLALTSSHSCKSHSPRVDRIVAFPATSSDTHMVVAGSSSVVEKSCIQSIYSANASKEHKRPKSSRKLWIKARPYHSRTPSHLEDDGIGHKFRCITN